MKKELLLFFIILLGLTYTYSQEHNTTSRLRIESGGSIYFNFNSLNKYENGLEYTNWTKITVYFIDTLKSDGSQTAMKWKLDVKAMSNDITGDAGPPHLDLNTIELEATSNDALATLSGIIPLTNSDVSLITNGSQTASGLTEVYITYYCGQSKLGLDNNLMGKKPDYYFVDLMLTLSPE